MLQEEYKIKIIKLITALMPDVSIYLFDSRAHAEHHPTADIDKEFYGNLKKTFCSIKKSS